MAADGTVDRGGSERAAGPGGDGLPARPRVRAELVFRSLGDEWVVYDPRDRRLHVLNVTSALIWSLCDGEHTVDDMVGVILDTLEEPPAREAVRADVQESLGAFAAEGLLR